MDETRRSSIQSLENDKIGWAAGFSEEGRPFLGPSVHHIHNVLRPKVFASVAPPWKDMAGNAVSPVESATIGHAVEAIGKPAGANRICPRDGGKGCAYVDT
jgi:hypothetical protein